MKTKTIEVYSYDELSPKAQQYAREEWISTEQYPWGSENEAVLTEFARIFPVRITDWAYGEYNSHANFELMEDRDIRELSGIRLLKYLWNNYRKHLYTGKYYPGHNIGRTSKIILEENTLTGYYIGHEILSPIFEFMSKPDKRTFEDLLQECLDAWVYACGRDVEYHFSNESTENNIRLNDYEFDENGVML
jgi:hypothetical protein